MSRAEAGTVMQRTVYILVLLALLAALAPQLADFWRWSMSVIAVPTGVDYGEGIVWEQFRGMFSGRGYGPVQGIPAIVYHYPPLYYLTVAVAEPFARDALQAGRFVSFAATVLTAVVLALMTRRLIEPHADRIAAWICAALSAAFFLHFNFVAYWGPLMRVDPVAVLATTAGVLCGMAALRRPALVYASALFFVLAVYGKQTSIVAPAAVFGTLLIVRRPLALRGIVTAIILGLVILALMLVITNGGFLKHIVEYNVNRFNLTNLRDGIRLGRLKLDMTALIFAGGCTLFFSLGLLDRSRWSPENRDRSTAMVMLLSFVVLKTGSLIALGKTGASTNYWVEWLAPVSVVAGLGLYTCFQAWMAPVTGWAGHARRIVALLLPIALIAGQFSPKREALPDVRADEAPEQRLIATARACHGWVIGADMVAILRAGKPVVWEPSIFAELASTGLYDEGPLIDALKSGRICAVIVENHPSLMRRFRQPILRAMEASFTRYYKTGRWLVFYQPRNQQLP